MSFDRQGSRLRFRTDQGRGGSTHGWKGAMHAGGFWRVTGHRVAVAGDTGFALTDPTSRTRAVVWAVHGTERNAPRLWELSRSYLGRVPSLSALIVAGGTVVVGGGARDGTGGTVWLLDPETGAVRQTLDLPARVTECGLAVADGTLYVAGEDGSVCCFGP
jgi:outer membrane protein assembly factor BamB